LTTDVGRPEQNYTVSQKKKHVTTQGAYNSGKPGKLREFFISGKLREFLITRGISLSVIVGIEFCA